MNKRIMPLGIDSFEKLRAEGYYYVDKTAFIKELLLQERFEVTLITRPRRFGKTLAMSMLAEFLDIRKKSGWLFEGLAVSEEKELCEAWMNQWPVLSVTWKDIEDLNFEQAQEQMAAVISELCVDHGYLLERTDIDEADKKMLLQLRNFTASATALRNSLYFLTRMMYEHYGKPVILLIDEYDVPLAKANENGYYRQMLNSIRGMLSKALKSNRYLKFAVITGCLRISGESIFTGANHFTTNALAGRRFESVFGFTEDEVKALLEEQGFLGRLLQIRQWYDGYRFGRAHIYCPWDVLNYVSDLQCDPDAEPAGYWKNTSHNDLIRNFIRQKEYNITEKLEMLLAGGTVRVRLCEDLTYDCLYASEENFWSVLYLTGYLTNGSVEEADRKKQLCAGEALLRIPNEEVRQIFTDTIAEWFKDSMTETNRQPFINALWNGEEDRASALLNEWLFQTISYYNYKEDFYHAFLAGIFAGFGYAVQSDREYGEGRPDLVVSDTKNRRIMVIEIKRSRTREAMEADCGIAVRQIGHRNYAGYFLDDYQTVICYGIAFFRKQCRIRGKLAVNQDREIW